jgi:16S rRNA (uracil1498-N3)-methyltransferase
MCPQQATLRPTREVTVAKYPSKEVVARAAAGDCEPILTPRFFCPPPLIAGADVALPPGTGHHAVRVLRLKEGDALLLFDGEGGECAARLIRIDGSTVLARIGERRSVERESPLAVTLVQGLAAADRMDYAIQKAVELGVAAIVPVMAARSVARVEGERARRRAEHWRQIVVAACEQCGRNRLPAIHAPCDFSKWLRAPSTAVSRLLLAPDAGRSLGELDRPDGAIELLVGPEGGFTPDESAAAVAAGFHLVRLGPRILRTETVASTALAAMNALWGDWR